MAFSPTTSWQIDGETVRYFVLGGSKITADGDCSLEIKRHLFFWNKSYNQSRKHIKKQRSYFYNKGLSIENHGFISSHVRMWELDPKESWALKNWCFWTVMLEKTLESPLDNKEMKTVHPKEISPEHSLEGLMLKLKIQYFCHLIWLTHWKRPWYWGRLKAGVEGDHRGWDSWSITNLLDMSLNKHLELVMYREGWLATVRGITKIQTWMNDWTELNVN